MATYSRENLLNTGSDPSTAESLCRYLLASPGLLVPPAYLVWEFKSAPAELRELCSLNGGDEDWLVVTAQRSDDPWYPSWIENLGVCALDEYVLDNAVIYVGSHA